MFSTTLRNSDPTLPSLFVLAMCSIGVVAGDALAAKDNGGLDHFEAKIRPVLLKYCYECHSAESETIGGELLLDSRAGVARGGENGPVINTKDPEKSRLLVALRYESEDLQMPPDDRLPEIVISDFEQWIKNGAPDPRDGQIASPMDAILLRAEQHWAFQPPTKPALPVFANKYVKEWPREDLDHFVLARFDRSGVTPLPAAQPEVLIRRLFYDLIGLPPSYEQVSEFAKHPSDSAYEKIVDELIASPQFGERWARHWLDVARYGDTKGYVFKEEREYPNAYKYRDWVIDSFNRDLPIDEFLSLQLAADHLVDAKNNEQRKNLAAMGYLTLGRRFVNNNHDIIDDRIDVIFRGMMGLTVSCARCHDHKYDPVSAADYYGLYGVLDSSKEQQDEDLPPRLIDKKHPYDVGVFRRGSGKDRTDRVPRQFPVFFAGKEAEPFTHGSGRLELAQAIVHRDNPLTARVFVNRVWSHLFGEAIVATTSDFGLRSESPSHPLLLDYLATQFVDGGWSLKRLIRSIVLSSAYRQESAFASAKDSKPPGSLVRRRHRDLESMRDAMLTVAGCLDLSETGGPSIRLDATPSQNRRTVYARVERQNLPGVLRTFDFASPDTHSPHRYKTTVPQQALFLMNSPFAQEIAKKVTARVRTSDEQNKPTQINDLYRIIFSRDAILLEVELGSRFLQQPIERAPLDSWQFGYGDVDESGKVSFTKFEHFANEQWQREGEFPGPRFGHASLRDEKGHPGVDHGVIRRWIAPHAGPLHIFGILRHEEKEGDGVRCWIVSNRQGVLGQWNAKTNRVKTRINSTAIEAGEVIDFIVGPGKTDAYDSFRWNPRLTLKRRAETKGAKQKMVTHTWESKSGFHGPTMRLSKWDGYVQALLMTNEFMFVD